MICANQQNHLNFMKQVLKHTYVSIGIYFVLVVVVGVGAHSWLLPKKQDLNEASNTRSKIAEVHGILAFPLKDNRVLLGASHNVFVGKVLSQSGVRSEILSPGVVIPISRFSVEPIWNIKGNLQGTVTVEQLGGYQAGILVVGEGGDAFGPSNGLGEGHLMQPGSTYLLSTRYESDGVYYLWDFPTASKLITGDDTLSNAQLQSLAANDYRAKELQAAYPNEILVADDVRNNNTRNSYVSTHTPPPAPPQAPPPTAAITPPVISNLTSVAGSTSTMTTWTTNKPATSQVLFGSTTAMGENVTPDTALVTNHSLLIPGLAPSTTYYYETQSQDGSGTIATSAQQSFTTLGQ